ncbi:MAG: protease inhibitor I42 family protein [bacterium]
MVGTRKYLSWLVIGLIISSSLVFAADNKTVKVKIGKPFTLKLKSNPTTGYIWHLADLPKNSAVRLVSIKYIPARPGLLGSGGEESWCFQAIRKGETPIKLSYMRCWEKDTPPIEVRTYKAIVTD